MKKTFVSLIALFAFLSGGWLYAQDSLRTFAPCSTPIRYALDDALLKEKVGTDLSTPATNPSFKGGVEELRKYFAANPLTDTKAKDIVFRVHIAFAVDCNGNYGNLSIVSKGKGDLQLLAQQVLAITEKMPQNWIPATANNANVDSYHVLSFTVVGGNLDKVWYR